MKLHTLFGYCFGKLIWNELYVYRCNTHSDFYFYLFFNYISFVLLRAVMKGTLFSAFY